jgi:hypothetical protein
MPNFLEQLVAEWYEYRGYFVRRNIKVGPRDKGGHEGELDVVAYQPVDKRLVHIETSMDSLPWKEREERFAMKFVSGDKYIHALFKGLDLPDRSERLVVLGYGSTKNHNMIGGAKIQLVSELMLEIRNEMRSQSSINENINVPEQYVILRSLQFAEFYWRGK